MKHYLRAFAASLLSVAPALSQTPAPPAIEVQGTLEKQVKWSGVVRVVGDLTIADNGVLEIAPGTQVIVADQDASNGGWNPKLVEIHVKGQLIVEGNPIAPVVIGPEGEGGTAVNTWHGIVLHRSSDESQRRDRLRGVRIHHAFAGLQIPFGGPMIEDSVFLMCGTGMEVSSAFKNETYRGVRGGPAGPEIRNCRFADCKAAIYAEAMATPMIERCVFYRCRFGIGSERPGNITHLMAPGCSVQQCALIDCGDGVVGCGLVRNTIFLRCKSVLKLSDYHDWIATDIDQVLFVDNLVHECANEISGDTAVAREMLRGDPAFQGPLEDLLKPWPPLPDCLQLGAASVAIGKARNGGDLGPMPGTRGTRTMRGWEHSGTAIETWTTAQAEVSKAWAKLTKVQPGTAQGKSWWAVVDTLGDGVVPLLPVLQNERKEAALACEFDVTEAGGRQIEFTADSELFEIALNGKVVAKLDGRRRFGAAADPVKVDVRGGRNLLVLHVLTWSSEPRVAAALSGAWQPVPPAAETAPPKVTVKAQPARGGAVVEASFAAALHWAGAPDRDFVQVRVKGLGEPRTVEARWTALGKLRIGPLPADYAKQEVEITFPGLRSVTGAPVAIEPQSLRIP